MEEYEIVAATTAGSSEASAKGVAKEVSLVLQKITKADSGTVDSEKH